MPKVSVVSKEKCLLDLPYIILFEIFSRLPKDKLIEVSKLHSKSRHIAGDTRLWKDVYIKYKSHDVLPGEGSNETFAFEELYSEPWPVKVVDLSGTKIKHPDSPRIGQVVKVTKLDMTSIIANNVTMEAILAKYPCVELNLKFCSRQDVLDHVLKIAPEAFQKQPYLEVLSISGHRRPKSVLEKPVEWYPWLTQVFDNCKNLKTLDLSHLHLSKYEMMRLVGNFPTSLEKLLFVGLWIDDNFYKSLAERVPNLKEVDALNASYPSLLKFKFLKALHITTVYYKSDKNCCIYWFLIRFPALKTIYIDPDVFEKETTFEEFRAALESHGIRTIIRQSMAAPGSKCPADGNFWLVSKLV